MEVAVVSGLVTIQADIDKWEISNLSDFSACADFPQIFEIAEIPMKKVRKLGLRNDLSAVLVCRSPSGLWAEPQERAELPEEEEVW